jgi:hypothetical protein
LVLSFSRAGDVVEELTNLAFSIDPATGLQHVAALVGVENDKIAWTLTGVLKRSAHRGTGGEKLDEHAVSAWLQPRWHR